jgi:hypothetical protein
MDDAGDQLARIFRADVIGGLRRDETVVLDVAEFLAVLARAAALVGGFEVEAVHVQLLDDRVDQLRLPGE